MNLHITYGDGDRRQKEEGGEPVLEQHLLRRSKAVPVNERLTLVPVPDCYEREGETVKNSLASPPFSFVLFVFCKDKRKVA